MAKPKTHKARRWVDAVGRAGRQTAHRLRAVAWHGAPWVHAARLQLSHCPPHDRLSPAGTMRTCRAGSCHTSPKTMTLAFQSKCLGPCQPQHPAQGRPVGCVRVCVPHEFPMPYTVACLHPCSLSPTPAALSLSSFSLSNTKTHMHTHTGRTCTPSPT
jgi:hypothetical protein